MSPVTSPSTPSRFAPPAEPPPTTRTQAKASFIDPYVSGCIYVRTFSCSLGLGSIIYQYLSD